MMVGGFGGGPELEKVAITALQLVDALRLKVLVNDPVAATNPVSSAPRDVPASCCCTVNPLPADTVPV